jgi:hypothetical protein
VELWSDPIQQLLEIREYLGDSIAVSACNRSTFLLSLSMFVSESTNINRVPFECKFSLDTGTYGTEVRCFCLYTVEPLLSGLMTGCRWPDNKKSRIIEDEPKTIC